MKRKWRIVFGAMLVLTIGVVAFAILSGEPKMSEKDTARNQQLMLSSQAVKSNMSRGDVESALGEPDERDTRFDIERWHTRGHLGHTVTVYYENDRVSKIENRTWRSKPNPSWWDNVRNRIGL